MSMTVPYYIDRQSALDLMTYIQSLELDGYEPAMVQSIGEGWYVRMLGVGEGAAAGWDGVQLRSHAEFEEWLAARRACGAIPV